MVRYTELNDDQQKAFESLEKNINIFDTDDQQTLKKGFKSDHIIMKYIKAVITKDHATPEIILLQSKFKTTKAHNFRGIIYKTDTAANGLDSDDDTTIASQVRKTTKPKATKKTIQKPIIGKKISVAAQAIRQLLAAVREKEERNKQQL
jgi:hypothetical protein